MEYSYIIFISIFVFLILVFVLLVDTKTSNNIHKKGNLLTIWHPLKKESINLDTDLLSWHVQRINVLWWGKLYAVNLKLKSGKWKKLYSRSRRGKFDQLINYLEKNALNKQTQPSD